MERLTIDDMIKALRCVASQDTEGDCYKDHENFKHMKDDKYKRIVCGTGENLKDWISGRDAVGCPYHQKTYGTCYEDGELYWLKDVAELLEELKSYKGLEEQGLLVRLPCKVGDMVLDNDFGYQELYEIKAFSYGYCDSYVEPDIGTEDEIIFYYENYTGSITGAFPMSEIGKTVFLTHKKAEDKLEELKNEI
jgi:hypothetical protein